MKTKQTVILLTLLFLGLNLKAQELKYDAIPEDRKVLIAQDNFDDPKQSLFSSKDGKFKNSTFVLSSSGDETTFSNTKLANFDYQSDFEITVDVNYLKIKKESERGLYISRLYNYNRSATTIYFWTDGNKVDAGETSGKYESYGFESKIMDKKNGFVNMTLRKVDERLYFYFDKALIGSINFPNIKFSSSNIIKKAIGIYARNATVEFDNFKIYYIKPLALSPKNVAKRLEIVDKLLMGDIETRQKAYEDLVKLASEGDILAQVWFYRILGIEYKYQRDSETANVRLIFLTDEEIEEMLETAYKYKYKENAGRFLRTWTHLIRYEERFNQSNLELASIGIGFSESEMDSLCLTMLSSKFIPFYWKVLDEGYKSKINSDLLYNSLQDIANDGFTYAYFYMAMIDKNRFSINGFKSNLKKSLDERSIDKSTYSLTLLKYYDKFNYDYFNKTLDELLSSGLIDANTRNLDMYISELMRKNFYDESGGKKDDNRKSKFDDFKKLLDKLFNSKLINADIYVFHLLSFFSDREIAEISDIDLIISALKKIPNLQPILDKHFEDEEFSGHKRIGYSGYDISKKLVLGLIYLNGYGIAKVDKNKAESLLLKARNVIAFESLVLNYNEEVINEVAKRYESSARNYGSKYGQTEAMQWFSLMANNVSGRMSKEAVEFGKERYEFHKNNMYQVYDVSYQRDEYQYTIQQDRYNDERKVYKTVTDTREEVKAVPRKTPFNPPPIPDIQILLKEYYEKFRIDRKKYWETNN